MSLFREISISLAFELLPRLRRGRETRAHFECKIWSVEPKTGSPLGDVWRMARRARDFVVPPCAKRRDFLLAQMG